MHSEIVKSSDVIESQPNMLILLPVYEILASQRSPLRSGVEHSTTGIKGDNIPYNLFGPPDASIEPEIRTRIGTLKSATTGLNRISATLTRIAGRDLLSKSKHIDVSHYQEFDKMHFRQKYPQASDYLIDRLLSTSANRRRLLRYYELRKERRQIKATGRSFSSFRVNISTDQAKQSIQCRDF